MEEDYSQLALAVAENDLNAVKVFTEEKHVYGGWKTAHVAADRGKLDILLYLKEKDPTLFTGIGGQPEESPNLRNVGDFESLLAHTATQIGNFSFIKNAIEEKKVSVDVPNERGEPLTFTALRWKHHKIFKYFVEEKQANLTITNADGNNILYIVAKIDDVAMARYILDERKAPIDINQPNKFGDTVLHAVVNAIGSEQDQRKPFNWREEIKLVEYLVKEKHANVNAVGRQKKTPLHVAAIHNHFKICNLLLDYGANGLLRDEGGYNYWETASSRKRKIRSIAPFSEVESHSMRLDRTGEREEVGVGAFPSVIGHRGREGAACSSENFSYMSNFSFLHFSVIAQFLFFNYTKRSNQRPVGIFLSPAEELRKKMDPTAVKAALNIL